MFLSLTLAITSLFVLYCYFFYYFCVFVVLNCLLLIIPFQVLRVCWKYGNMKKTTKKKQGWQLWIPFLISKSDNGHSPHKGCSSGERFAFMKYLFWVCYSCEVNSICDTHETALSVQEWTFSTGNESHIGYAVKIVFRRRNAGWSYMLAC